MEVPALTGSPFRLPEFMFQQMEHKFQGTELTFHGLELKTYTDGCRSLIVQDTIRDMPFQPGGRRIIIFCSLRQG